jgi:protein-tyrosine phosphatase
LLSSFAAVSVAWTRRVQLEGAANFRDLGGYPTTQGPVVATGRVFRSDSLHLCSEQDLAVLDALGIRAVYDLRRQEEIEEAPGPRRHVHLEVLSRRLRDTDPVTLQERADGERWLFEDYRSMLERSGGVFGTLFGRLVEPEGAPCVFHCLGGKDRTGIAAALLLSWLGVDRETILDDYEMTGELSGPVRLPHVVDAFVAMGFGRAAAEALLTTPRWAMADALDLLDNDHGGIESYLRGPAGMSAHTLERLRNDLTATDTTQARTGVPRAGGRGRFHQWDIGG